MNKCKKALSMLVGLTSIFSMTACNSIKATKKTGSLLDYTTSDGTKVDFTTNDLLINYFEENSASTSDVYNIVYEAMLKKYFEKEENKTTLTELERKAKDDVKKKKDDAQSNADSNKTKYKDEWEKILDTELSDYKEGKRTEKVLYNKYLVTAMKSKLSDIFYDEFKDWNWKDKYQSGTKEYELQKGFNIFSGNNGYLEKRIPYHVSHILVKVDASSNTIYNGEISADDASQIYNVVDPLAHGDFKFGTVAEMNSDDSSKSSYGNLGIMDIATSFVNEFKLGIYIYDALFNDNEQVKEAIKGDPFNMDAETTDYFEKLGVNFIPYTAVEDIYKYRNTTLDAQNRQVNDGNANYYPRNILFNKYFNSHNISFITKESSDFENAAALKLNGKTGNDGKTYYTDLNDQGKWSNGSKLTDASLTGFKEITFKNGVKKEILCDEKGNPIIVTRAGTSDYQGIHFIVVERDGLETTKDGVSLEQYYAADTPYLTDGTINPNFPLSSDNQPLNTYINNTISDYNTYKSRAENLKTTIKDFDSTYDERVYEWLLQTSELGQADIIVKYGDKEVNWTEKINKYVYQRIEKNASSYTISEDTWEEYIDYLKNQETQRATKLIPETCAVGFSSGTGYDAEGVCYYAK